MRYSNDMFHREHYSDSNSRKSISGVLIITIILSVLSIACAIAIIANFGLVTAKIAIFVSDLLTSGAILLISLISIIYIVIKIKFKIYRHFLRL